MISMEKENKLFLTVLRSNGEIYLSNTEISSVNWNYFLELCHKHRVTNIVYSKIKNSTGIPKHIRKIFVNEWQTQTHISSGKQADFLRVLDALNKQNIHVILLKGVYLAAKCYDHLAQRPYNDMDILVQENDSRKVFQIFIEHGYVQGKYDFADDKVIELSEERLIGYENELQHYGEFVKKADDDFYQCYSVDIHHRLTTIFDNVNFNINEMFSRSFKDNIDGIEFYRLDHEDFLLHLCSHLYWHTLSIRDIISGRDIRLLMYYDLYEFLHTFEVNWNCLFERADKANARRALEYTLYNCNQLFPNTIPEMVYREYDETEMEKISNTIYDRWFTRSTDIPVGKWSRNFIERLFDENRVSEALLSLYSDYINSVLFNGGYFKVINIEDKTRFMT